MHGNGAAVPVQGGATGTSASFQDRQLEIQIQKAIELSLASQQQQQEPDQESQETRRPEILDNGEVVSGGDRELELALQLSQKELEDNKKKQEEEDEILKKILALSMSEK